MDFLIAFPARATVRSGLNSPLVINFPRFATSSDIGVNGSDLLYMNGTTDYLEVFGFLTASSGNIFQSDTTTGFNTFFSAFLARAT